MGQLCCRCVFSSPARDVQPSCAPEKPLPDAQIALDLIYVYPFPAFLRDVGIEVEGRSSRWGNPIANLREDTGMIGGIYSYSHLGRLRPYGKFLAGVGSMEFPAFKGIPNYTHDTFFADATAGGADIQLFQGIWVRGKYQYQWWHNVFGPGHTFTPNGISVGLHSTSEA